VCRDENGAAFLAEALEQRPELAARLGIEAGRGLVEE
jgi:hypothetical protein